MEAFGALTLQKNIDLFERFHIFSPKETAARYEIQLDNYARTIKIEAATMLEMARRQIIPACIAYTGKVAESVKEIRSCGIEPQKIAQHLQELCILSEAAMERADSLEEILQESYTGSEETARAMSERVRPAMEQLREVCDRMEMAVDAKDWPIPTYTDLLHRI